ncbi:MAG: SDR family oxidoreductase [Pseudomonadota bacterium]
MPSAQSEPTGSGAGLALVTGGSSGIGLAVADRLVARGRPVAILARNPDRLEAARQFLETRNQAGAGTILAIAADVQSEEQVRTAIDTIAREVGPVETLVAAAGIARPNYFARHSVNDFRDQMETNFFGSLHPARAVYADMVSRGRGQIVFIASGAAFMGLFGYSAYGASKFALRGLAESLHAESQGTGVRISICYPPDTDTPQLIEENRTKPPETKAITGSVKVWQAGAVADALLKGMDTGRFQITPGFDLSALGRLHSLIAPLLRWHFNRLAARARQTG